MQMNIQPPTPPPPNYTEVSYQYTAFDITVFLMLLHIFIDLYNFINNYCFLMRNFQKLLIQSFSSNH